MVNKEDFFSYINTEMSIDSIRLVYKANNVLYDRCELYSDFVKSLLKLVYDTYLGDEYTDVNNRTLHYHWCWNKNIENFILEGININSNKLYDYFLQYLIETFYFTEKNNMRKIEEDSLRLWSSIFNYNRNKTKAEMDTFIEIYTLFNQSLVLL
jgi:hypothetical protein